MSFFLLLGFLANSVVFLLFVGYHYCDNSYHSYDNFISFCFKIGGINIVELSHGRRPAEAYRRWLPFVNTQGCGAFELLL